jgi:tyrosyl-tRNA synthetase
MNIDEQVAYLMQGTEYGDDSLKMAMTAELKQRLIEAKNEGRPLRVYCGYDPRKADLHLGHTLTMRKLRQFQELGHEAIFLIGNYTSLIGDPSDKDVLRPQLSTEEIEANSRTYAEQAFRILDPEKTIIRYNSEWLSKVSFTQLIKLASNFTIQQFLTRENFKLRWERNEAIFLHETFYSLMQGYDAYSMRCDVQIGGTDQLFNIITAARKIMSFLGEKPNIGIILGILPGTDGLVKMSKSLGNHIPINTDADDMYGQVMSIPDKSMPTYFRLVTRFKPSEIEFVEKRMVSGELHPRDAKIMLAKEIVGSFYGDKDSQEAQEAFIRLFQKHDSPEQVAEFKLTPGMSLALVLVSTGLAGSKGEARRLVDQKGVKLDGEILTSAGDVLNRPGMLQVGKRHFVRLVH